MITSLFMIAHRTQRLSKTPKHTSLGDGMLLVVENQQDTAMIGLGCLTGSRKHFTLKSHPSLVWHKRQLNPGYRYLSLLYLPISLFIFSILLYRWSHGRRQAGRRCHQIKWPEEPETKDRSRPLPFIDKGIIQEITVVYTTVASTGISLLFPYFFASTRMSITFYRLTSQGAGCLHTAPLPLCRRYPRLPRPAIGTLNIWDARGYGLEQR